MSDREGVRIIRDFVEGRLPGPEFEQRLVSEPGLEALLDDDPARPTHGYVGRSMFLYLLEQDYGDIGGLLNAQGAASEWLARHNIEHVQDSSAGDLYDLLLAAQPSWLSVDTKYLGTAFLARAEGRMGESLQAWLREELLRAFRFVNEPPDWIQNPEWPIGTAGPLVFLGQVSVEKYFHDIAAVYVFHDPSTGECTTVVQVA